LVDGQVITGGVVSIIDTVWLQVLVWPQASTSCHVRVTTVGQAPLVTVPITTRELVPWQGVAASGGSNDQAVPHCTTLLVEQASSGYLHLPAGPALKIP